MGLHSSILGETCFLLLLFLVKPSFQNVHKDVDLVITLNNNWVVYSLKEFSKGNENVVSSPFGIITNLGMLLEAAGGKARDEFLSALNISSDEALNLRKGFKAYCDLFLKFSGDAEAAGSFNFGTMTSSSPLKSDYKDILEKYYCANITETRSGSKTSLELSSVAGVMSHWKDYEKLAVYTFLSHKSMKAFKTKNGLSQTIPMIPQVGIFKIRRWENSQVILLPLQSKLVHLLIIVPDDMDKLDVLMKKLSEFTIPLLVESLQKEEVELFLPQLAVVNKNLNLTSLLMQHGFGRAFDPSRADFSRASSESKNLHLSKIEQNAFFSTSFNSLNTVSGISSSIDLARRTKRNTKTIIVDQPFLFFILQKDTQLVLINGKIQNPLQVPS